MLQLRSALAIIQEHEPARITTVGGECSVSMAPFSYLSNKHGDDVAVLLVDSHPDMGTGGTAHPGFHAMVVSALTGHGDQELLEILPATTTADRVALVGGTEPILGNADHPIPVGNFGGRVADASRGGNSVGP